MICLSVTPLSVFTEPESPPDDPPESSLLLPQPATTPASSRHAASHPAMALVDPLMRSAPWWW